MKAMLIVDMPKSCEDCELCRDGYLCLRLGEVGESVENGTKDLRCPLKPMPNKKEEISIDDTKISLKVNNHVVVHKINFEKAILYAKQRGFNDCLNEILGEEE